MAAPNHLDGSDGVGNLPRAATDRGGSTELAQGHAEFETSTQNRLEELFAAAAAQPAADRAKWLVAECANLPELRRELDVLLASHDSTAFMEPVSRLTEFAVEVARFKPEEA